MQKNFRVPRRGHGPSGPMSFVGGRGREKNGGRGGINKYPEWLSQKLGSTANAAVNS